MSSIRTNLLFACALFICMMSCNGPSEEIKTEETTLLSATHNLNPAFWDYAVSSNMLQVELGKLAADKAISLQLKDWGIETAAYHIDALQRLKSIGAGHDAILLPDSLGTADKAMVHEFSVLEGADFDARYLEYLRVSYEAQQQRYTEALEDADSPNLVNWLKGMQQHQRERLQELVKLDSLQTEVISE